jgi:SAM-dependent methyltransferase
VAVDTYGIKRSYRPRAEYVPFDDTPLKGEWQREVYQRAADLMAENGYRTVVDVGCGSGYKLVNMLGQYDTLGLEVSPTLEFLQTTYPDRMWAKSDFDTKTPPAADLVICADVVEHLLNPDDLMRFLGRLDFKLLVLSTSDRKLLYGFWDAGRKGPPANHSHVREWAFREFRTYVDRWFQVVEHAVTNREQATQMAVCRKKAG